MTMIAKYYYEKPDGEDLAGKSLLCAKRGVLVGLLASSVFAISKTGPRTVIGKCAGSIRRMFYLGSIGFVFANGTYVATRIRGKDDPINHFIGGLCTAPLFKSFLKLPGPLITEIVFTMSVFLLANKWRTTVKSGHETPYAYIFDGIRNRNAHWDYWEYLTGEVKPLNDYAN